MNKKTCLNLSGLCDIYSVFGHGVNILQTVNMLPHEKYKKFMMCINVLTNMRETISDHNSEKCLQKCLWPTYHKDVAELKNTGKYRGILIVADDAPKRKDNITRYFKR